MFYHKYYFNIMLLMFALFLGACSNSAYQEAGNIEGSVKAQVSSVSPKGIGDGEDKVVRVDRWERFNRGVYRFNKGLDNTLVKPAARAYKFVMPDFFDKSISNFFLNLGDVGNAVNNLLQFKPRAAVNDSARFLFNSSFGLGGFLDVASEMGLEKHHEDFGQTLAIWGIDSGPYLVLPVLGPSTVRDAAARFSVDTATDPVSYHEDAFLAIALKLFDDRADLLSAEETFNDIAIDQYSAIRDAWLQQREYLIRDGKIDEQEQSDLIDELELLDVE